MSTIVDIRRLKVKTHLWLTSSPQTTTQTHRTQQYQLRAGDYLELAKNKKSILNVKRLLVEQT